jgi:hypothetical protein
MLCFGKLTCPFKIITGGVMTHVGDMTTRTNPYTGLLTEKLPGQCYLWTSTDFLLSKANSTSSTTRHAWSCPDPSVLSSVLSLAHCFFRP